MNKGSITSKPEERKEEERSGEERKEEGQGKMHFSSVALPSTLFNTAGAGQQVYSVGKTLGRVKDSHRSIGVCVIG